MDRPDLLPRFGVRVPDEHVERAEPLTLLERVEELLSMFVLERLLREVYRVDEADHAFCTVAWSEQCVTDRLDEEISDRKQCRIDSEVSGQHVEEGSFVDTLRRDDEVGQHAVWCVDVTDTTVVDDGRFFRDLFLIGHCPSLCIVGGLLLCQRS